MAAQSDREALLALIRRFQDENESRPDVMSILQNLYAVATRGGSITENQIKAFVKFTKRYGFNRQMFHPLPAGRNPYSGESGTRIKQLLQQNFPNWAHIPDTEDFHELLSYGLSPQELLTSVFRFRYARDYNVDEVNSFLQSNDELRTLINQRDRPPIPTVSQDRMRQIRDAAEGRRQGRAAQRETPQEAAEAGESVEERKARGPDQPPQESEADRQRREADEFRAREPLAGRGGARVGEQQAFEDQGMAMYNQIRDEILQELAGQIPQIRARPVGGRPQFGDLLRFGGIIGGAALGNVMANAMRQPPQPPNDPPKSQTSHDFENSGPAPTPRPTPPSPEPGPLFDPASEPERKRRRETLRPRFKGDEMHNPYEQNPQPLPVGYAYYPDPFKHKPQIDKEYVGNYKLPVYGRHNYVKWSRYTINNTLASAY